MKLEINYKKKGGEKNHKYVETEQHATEQLLGQQRNHRKNKNYLKTNESEILTYQNL